MQLPEIGTGIVGLRRLQPDRFTEHSTKITVEVL